MNKIITLIAAIDKRNGLGKDNDLLFRIPADIARFKAATFGHTVIMGRKTWESLPTKFRPLPMRSNFVVSRNPTYPAPGAALFQSIEAAMQAAVTNEVFVIGGGDMYRLALPYCTYLDLTCIDADGHADVHFPPIDLERFTPISREPGKHEGLSYAFTRYQRTPRHT